MYIINTKPGKWITLSAIKIAPKELFRKLVRVRLHTRSHLIMCAGQFSCAHAISNLGNHWQRPEEAYPNTITQH